MKDFDPNILVAYGLIVAGMVGCLWVLVGWAWGCLKPVKRPHDTEFIDE